jgi:general nucleoside transport system permease protein
VLAAMVFGMLWAAVPAALQAYRGSHVVITTIMFNFIASALLSYLLVNVLKEPGNMTVESRRFADSARLPGVHDALAWLGVEWPRTPLNLSLLLAVAATVAVWALLWHTRPGDAGDGDLWRAGRAGGRE